MKTSRQHLLSPQSKRLSSWMGVGMCLLVSWMCLQKHGMAQSGLDHPGANHYHPLSQHSPPGQAAAWLNYLRQYDPSWLQPLQIEVASGGYVEVFSGSNIPVGAQQSPALVAANVGHLYRLRVSNMAAFPGVDIFPTVELLDRMHPPAGREDEFPIPIILTEEDIRTALQGQLVTRVIYLEQPQIAQVMDPLRREIPQTISPSENALKEADRLGRPMAIIRIGGRRPSPTSPPSFFGTGGAVQLRTPVEHNGNGGGAMVRMRLPAPIQQTSTKQFQP